ncbi:MAG TPA: NADH-quinone oxidoreductase subunit L [Pilimelia sp.]|nr:NADH-quinone oxidoreductase subunit L [Pilimelia sp.]
MTVRVLGALLPAVPLLLGLLGLLLRPRSRALAAGLGVAGAAAALVVAVLAVAATDGLVEGSARWLRLGDLTVTVGVRMDPTAALVAVAVAAVALAVQVYSIGYLHDDDRYPPYAAQVAIFTGAMLLVVVAGDLLMLLVGWEVMGVCSYLLIAHDRRLPEAPAAAVKAFLVTRVGDVGFLLGIAVLGIGAGSFRIADVLAHPHSAGTLTAAGLLLLAGVAGKSAQFPLHTWLPDAMAGPTPISALIHAATMVAAGVYVVARLYPVFAASPAVLAVLGVMAAVTLLLGALAATGQDDIKRVLAWSTVSQLGYMTGALAVGATGAALFHLLTHAAFKALLFLAAGCVIHAVGSNLMSAMGGLRTTMPVTFWSMAVGLAALVGLPPLAGFWSKEGVLAAARHPAGPVPGWVAWLVWAAALAGVAVTAWYATSLLLRTFFGPAAASRAPVTALPVGGAPPDRPADRSRDQLGNPSRDRPADPPRDPVPAVPPRAPHDPPPLLRWPVLALAVPAALLGLAAFLPGFRRAIGLAAPHAGVELLLALGLLAAGAGAAWWRWRGGVPPQPAPPAAFAEALWLDRVQRALVVRPVRALARTARAVDERVVDGAVEGTGRALRGLGGRFAGAHRAALPRAATAALAGALLVGVLAAVLGGAR